MPGPNISIHQQTLIDYVYRILSCIDPLVHSQQDLEIARQLLMEMNNLIIHAQIEQNKQNSLPRVSSSRF